LGQIDWGDHDMFHSNDKFAGRMMAVSKALSGGPVYLSDPFDHLLLDPIRPLCYEDGLLLRPVAPAAPLPEDLFQPRDAGRLFRVMAPLANRAVALAVYNLQGDAKEHFPEFTTTIVPDDYVAAGGMMQPYPGPWKLPDEGLVVFDYDEQAALPLANGYDVTIKGFGDRLLQLSPIENGWSVIGRTDKYLPAAAVTGLSSTATTLDMTLHETGPFAIWLDRGKPTAEGVRFTRRGNGLCVADLPVQSKPLKIRITKR
jgi:hypothetical protein